MTTPVSSGFAVLRQRNFSFYLSALLLGGVATLMVTTLWALGFPVLRRMDRFPQPANNQGSKQ